jgi:hypothetical protein
MAKPVHPARSAPAALSLLGLSFLGAAIAAALLLLGHPAAGGTAALVAAVSLFAVTSAPTPRVSFALGAVAPLCDAAVLAPLAWTARFDDPRVSALALAALGTTLVASYERARSSALGYRTPRTRAVRLLRQALPAVGVIVGGAVLEWTLWAALAVAGITLVVRAANVVLQERAGVAPAGGSP